jgi:hypothetical protein
MKKILSLFVSLAMAAGMHASDSPARDPQYSQLLEGLQRDIEYLQPATIKEELTPAQVWEESEKEWAMVMKNFRARLAENGLAGRDDIVRSKEQVHESWKRDCRVLLDQAQKKGAVLRRYDEGEGGSTGYTIVIDGKPTYWLHRRFNRERDNY